VIRDVAAVLSNGAQPVFGMDTWNQVYNSLNNPILSTACAALPIFVLLSGLAFFHIKAHVAASLV
jgi:hypothetical protein